MTADGRALRLLRRLNVGPEVWVARISRRVIDPVYVALWGAETDGYVSPAELGVDGTESLPYLPSPWLVMPLVMWACRPGPEDVLVDLGCGKGRVLLQAARRPLRRVVGVDGSAEMTALAWENLARHRSRLRCGSFEVHTADLREYELPVDTSILFCFNAVRGSVFAAVLAQMLAHAERRGANLRFAYYLPLEHDAIMASGRARLRRVIPANPVTVFPIHVYDVLAPPPPGSPAR